jgi:hypothetical protein
MSTGKRRETLLFSSFLCLFDLRPSLLSGKPSDLAPTLRRHGLKPAFTADLTALSAHFGHDERDHRTTDGYRRVWFGSSDRFIEYPLRVLSNIKAVIRTPGRFTTALWHTLSVAQLAEASQAGGFSN